MDTIRIFKDSAGEFRWQRRAGNGEVVSHGEGHTRRWDAQRAAQRANPDSGWTYGRDSRS